MTKSVKNIIMIIIAIAFLIGGFNLTRCYQLKNSTKELILAIENNNLQMAKDIVSKDPKCVNSLPTMAPRWWQLFSEQPAVFLPLQEACYWGRYDIVELLVDNGADCNLAWKGIEASKPPLSCAVLSESEDTELIVQLLLEHGADITIRDERGKTPYDYAMENGHNELAEILRP